MRAGVRSNVAGKKAIVMTAMVFIDELSRFALSAKSIFALASSWVSRAKSWYIISNTVRDPEQLEKLQNLDLDIRWTVLCDLFLLLLADSSYDARSRTLLEHVGEALSVPWVEVCRFEKRVTDALEMQEEADKENWNEEEHLEARRKAARNKRLMVMGLCTVGGGLVIGLSAGLLAPVIGAGLAAGFTGIGVAGTGGFLGGTGAAALIGGGGALTGGIIGVRASDRRTGSVKTFEYRPLHNNKRVSCYITMGG